MRTSADRPGFAQDVVIDGAELLQFLRAEGLDAEQVVLSAGI